MCQVCEAKEKVGKLEAMRNEKERELFVLEGMIEYAKLEVRVAELEWMLSQPKEDDGPKMEDPYVREDQRPYAAKERGR
jgi:hypothetical protein